MSSILREELYHPIISHFPIVLMSLLPCFQLAAYIVKKPGVGFLKQTCLYGGSLFYFMSMFTGDHAADHIKSTFCYLGEIYQHEQSAEYGLIALIVTLMLDISGRMFQDKKVKSILNHCVSLSCLTILYFVITTSHQGAMLVYDRGAGVNANVQKCE